MSWPGIKRSPIKQGQIPFRIYSEEPFLLPENGKAFRFYEPIYPYIESPYSPCVHTIQSCKTGNRMTKRKFQFSYAHPRLDGRLQEGVKEATYTSMPSSRGWASLRFGRKRILTTNYTFTSKIAQRREIHSSLEWNFRIEFKWRGSTEKRNTSMKTRRLTVYSGKSKRRLTATKE